MQNGIQEGERQLWMEAIDSGQVDAALVFKRWQTVLDLDVCPICEPMHDQVRPFNEDFSSSFNGWTGLRPGAHPRCRCFVEVDARGEQFGADDVT